MVAVEFPAEWDEGVDNHGVYGEESYHEGDVDDTYQQDEQGEQEEAGDGMDDIALDVHNENENENQDHDDTHEEAQDDPDEFEEIAEEIEAETGWDIANYESSRKRNRSGQKGGSWHQHERWSEHTNKEPTDNQEQSSDIDWCFHFTNSYHVQMPSGGSALQNPPKVQKLEARHSPPSQVQKLETRHSPPSQVVHPWHTEVTSSEPEQREQRIWPAGLASSLKKGGKGGKTKGGKGKTKYAKGNAKGLKGPNGKGKAKDAPGKGKRPLLQPQSLLPDTTRGLKRPKLVGPPTGPGPQTVPARPEGPQTVPARPEGPRTVPARPGGPQTVPARPGGPRTVPARPGGPRTVPARPGGPRTVPARPGGAKRPLGVGANHQGAKGFKAEPRAPKERQRTAPTMKVSLKPMAAEKLKQLQSRGVKLTPEALRGLAAADAKDAEVLMQALLSRGEVPNPSNFITASLANLAKRQATAAAPIEQSKSVQHQPAARAAPGQGQPPKRRTVDLSFERLAVQAKLFALNKQGIWAKQGKALDEAALSALLAIDPDRGLEILDEVESRGVGLIDPSRYARDLAADEEKIYPPS